MTPLSCSVSGGKVLLQNDAVKLQLSYPASAVECQVEEKVMDDKKLANVWGEKLNRIVFKVKGEKTKNNLAFELTKI